MRKLDGSVGDIGQRGGESTLNVFISMRDRQRYVCLCICASDVVCGVYRQSVVCACVYAQHTH